MKAYWTKHETEQLKIYQTADMDLRNKIFDETLFPALNTLTEVVINMSSIYKGIERQNLSDECLTHLTLLLDRMQCEKNVFGYLSMAGKHFVYQYCMKRHKLDYRDVSLDDDKENDQEMRYYVENQITKETDDSLIAQIEDLEPLRKAVIDYWTEDRLKCRINLLRFSWHKRRGIFERIKYYLCELGSTSFKTPPKKRKTRYHYSIKYAATVLHLITKESISEILTSEKFGVLNS